jgi:hypothetical protein
VATTPTPEEKLEFIQSRIRALQSTEQRKLSDANKNIAGAAKEGGRTGQHCVVNPDRLPQSPVEVAVGYVETQLVSSTKAFVYSWCHSKLESIGLTHTPAETVQKVQRALGFALASKAADRVSRNVSWVKTASAEVEIAALGELQLIFLEAETGDTSGEII